MNDATQLEESLQRDIDLIRSKVERMAELAEAGPAAMAGRKWRWRMMARGFPPRRWSRCSSGFSGWTRRAVGKPVARAWDWRS